MDEKYIEERFKNVDKQLENHEKRLAKVEETYAIMKQMDLRVGNIEKSVETIHEHFPYYSEMIFLAEQIKDEDVPNLYVEEDKE